MAADPRVLGLLEEMLDAGKTPDEVCRGCPELLAEVRERWREFHLIDAAFVELLPGLRTAQGVGAVTPVAPAADLAEQFVPGHLRQVGGGGHGRDRADIRGRPKAREQLEHLGVAGHR